MFDPAEVEQLARKSRPRRSTGSVKLTIETAVTEITHCTLRYRGYQVTTLASQRGFEDVAVRPWSGSRPEARAIVILYFPGPILLAMAAISAARAYRPTRTCPSSPAGGRKPAR